MSNIIKAQNNQTPAIVDTSAALVYLASLTTQSGRRTMRQALDTIADIVYPGATLESFPWHELRFQHTTAIRTKLSERYAPATTNRAWI